MVEDQGNHQPLVEHALFLVEACEKWETNSLVHTQSHSLDEHLQKNIFASKYKALFPMNYLLKSNLKRKCEQYRRCHVLCCLMQVEIPLMNMGLVVTTDFSIFFVAPLSQQAVHNVSSRCEKICLKWKDILCPWETFKAQLQKRRNIISSENSHSSEASVYLWCVF